MLEATALIYSSHNRCPHIHRDWIVERALKSHHNKTILQLPMSMNERHQQEYGWGNFRWYFNQFTQWGLEPSTFFWDDNLKKEDVDVLFDKLRHSQVVILGGGNPQLGYMRYRALGERYYGDPDKFNATLWQRANDGLLTCGFSAGSTQLEQYLDRDGSPSFGLARNIVTCQHYEWGREEDLRHLANRYHHCFAFGLPNDSGVAVQMGQLPSGNIWQIIEFIVDTTWDIPEDNWHIKTRSGMNIDHIYADGRKWTFHNGDRIVRVMSLDNRYQESWIFSHGAIFDYWSQQRSGYHNIDHIFATH